MLISKGFINNKEVENTFETINPNENSFHLSNDKINASKTFFVIRNPVDLLVQECDVAKKEYLTMVEDIHAIISNREDLSNSEKINYCNSERHYMKQYLKHTMIKISRTLPD